MVGVGGDVKASNDSPKRFFLVVYSGLVKGKKGGKKSNESDGDGEAESSMAKVASRLLGQLITLLQESDRVLWGRLAGPQGPMWVEDAEEALADNLSSRWQRSDCSQKRTNAVHALLDALPHHLGFILDIIWIMPKLPSLNETPADMYECVKRAREWHGAGVIVMPLIPPGGRMPHNDILVDLGAETLFYADVEDSMAEFVDPRLLWRGRLVLPGRDQTVAGFEMVAHDRETLGVALKSSRCGGLSRSGSGFSAGSGPGGPLFTMRLSGVLKPLSWVRRDNVPKATLTDKKFSLRYSFCNGDGELGELFMVHDNFRKMCAVAKLEFCEPDAVSAATSSASLSLFSATAGAGDGDSSGTTMGRTGENWRRCVLDGNWARSTDDILSGTDMEAAYFVIFKEDGAADALEYRNVLELSMVLLDTSAILVPHCLSDQMPAEMDIDVDTSKLEKVTDSFYLPESDDGASGECHTESDWPEFRVIAQLEKFRKMQLAASARGRSKASGDLLMLEASEFLKHFDESGEPKDPDKLVPLNPRRTPLVAMEEEARAADFEEALRLSHPALHYLRQGEDPEATDFARVIRQVMGVRETHSSCLVAGDRKADFVSKASSEDGKGQDKQRTQKSTARTPLSPLAHEQQQQQQQLNHSEKEVKGTRRLGSGELPPLSRRASSTRAASTTGSASVSAAGAKLSREEVFKRKLRNAVYEALIGEGVDENSELFRPCFRRLYSVVKVFGEGALSGDDQSGGQQSSTKKLLAEAAKNNVKLTVAMERKANNRSSKSNGDSTSTSKLRPRRR